jgi:RNA polymerase sigma-B factor
VVIQDDERRRLREQFEVYRATGDLAVRDQLVASHLRLATHLARRFAHRGVPADDLEQVAALGLLKAVDRFEPERGLEFSTFATPTIVGELKRYFRDKGWAVRVPRRVQELHVRLNALVGDLTHALGRSPTVAELARAARTSEEEVLEAMEAAQAYRSNSIDGGPGPDDDSPAGGSHLGVDDHGLFDAENRVFVDELLEHLPPRDQLMLRMRYYDEMTQSEIADRLGISQMHVSRLLTRCLTDLRRRIEVSRGEVPS